MREGLEGVEGGWEEGEKGFNSGRGGRKVGGDVILALIMEARPHLPTGNRSLLYLTVRECV